ncbi:hypothetical protein AX14_007110 [Amanita brunnescens Koide BX004]|nr:hypothetical protein AX14_007110 [Amanita brunnescens Koide BX004]
MPKLVGRQFRTTLQPPGPLHLVIVEDWRFGGFDISQDVLYYISLPQPVQAIYSTRPGKTLEAQQQVLSRFSLLYWYYTALSRPGISNEVTAPGMRKSWSKEYQLCGELYLHGISASGGRYALGVLHPTRFVCGKGGGEAKR